MRNVINSIAMSALGAAAMYYLDPERGYRRRLLMRHRLALAAQEAGDFVQEQRQRAAEQAQELAAATRRPFSHASEYFAEDSLAERVSDEFNQWMSHPNIINRARASMATGSQGTLMGSLFKVVALCAASAAVMYYLDPEMGRRRRGLVRDKLDSMSHGARDYARTRGKMAADHVKGVAAKARAPFAGLSRPGSDRQLHERIRSELGHVVTRPNAIKVIVHQGNVTLSGYVLASELDPLLSMVQAISGVQHVDNRLEVHAEPSRIPSLHSGERSTLGDGTTSRLAGKAGSWH